MMRASTRRSLSRPGLQAANITLPQMTAIVSPHVRLDIKKKTSKLIFTFMHPYDITLQDLLKRQMEMGGQKLR